MENPIILHPQAKELLFKHYRPIYRIFRDALGQLDVGYISIALLTPKNELLFFSSRPSIEWNMIEHHSWRSDPRFQHHFFKQEQTHHWRFNHSQSEFHEGISISSSLDNYHVVYTFSSRSKDRNTQETMVNNVAKLTRMGKFCLKNILDEIGILHKPSHIIQQKPKLTLIVNKNKLNNRSKK